MNNSVIPKKALNIIAVSLEYKSLETYFYWTAYIGIHWAEMTTNTMHLGEMHPSVATHSTPLFSSHLGEMHPGKAGNMQWNCGITRFTQEKVTI